MDLRHRGLWILSAPIGAGKTTFCRALVDAARSAGASVGGLLSPAIFAEGTKTGIAVERLSLGETRPLAGLTRTSERDLVIGKRWFFDADVMAWSAEEFERTPACDLFVVDELGPLEFALAQGWVGAFAALQTRAYRDGLVVIRPDLVGEARRRLPVTGVVDVPTRAALAGPLAWLNRIASEVDERRMTNDEG